ncbi:hypothetical protein ARMGADRAFT_1033239 [Armillaria gallica]|uniref:Uncharacterized protein n=1 Tax=Armillaria gallica TaxID=47427 RepID=A0A2H3D397_ARMGA|nr:hypothetical protein ARMGADRAFT_1033239 [Armillaria gallica]
MADKEHSIKVMVFIKVNHEEKVCIRKDENVVLRLLGVQICKGFEMRKWPWSSSTVSDIHVVEEQLSLMKTLPLNLDAGANIRSIDDLIDLSISDDDDLYAPRNSSQLGDTILPPSTG